MFFVLSKLLFFLIDPLTWILGLVVLGIFAKHPPRKKKYLAWALGLFLLFTNPYLFQKVSLWYQPAPVQLAPQAKYSVGILLGGMSFYDQHKVGHFAATADRFIQTANLYHEGKINKILVSSGSGSLYQKDSAEAIFLYQEFLRNGIPDSALIIEDKSRNTYENAIYSKKILDSLGLTGPYLLITSAQHMPRSKAIFDKAGYKNFLAYPVDFQEYERKWEPRNVFVPSADKLKNWHALIKEWVGLLAYRLTGKI